MASVNKVILIGNLGQAPDVRITNSGIKVAEISIATSSYFNRDNERVEKTTWHTVTLWNKRFIPACAGNSLELLRWP